MAAVRVKGFTSERGDHAAAKERKERGQPLEEWAAEHGGKPVDEVLCANLRCPATDTPHVHPRLLPRAVAYVDPDTGRWLR